jgi:hypothetical protein
MILGLMQAGKRRSTAASKNSTTRQDVMTHKPYLQQIAGVPYMTQGGIKVIKPAAGRKLGHRAMTMRGATSPAELGLRHCSTYTRFHTAANERLI